MEVSVRRAHADDVDTLRALIAEFYATDDHPFDPATVDAGLAPLLDDDHLGVVWLATDDGGRAVGYAVVTWGWSIEAGGLDVVLDELYARERGRGIGGLLIDHVEADCRARGVRRIFLETEAPNDAARRLYRRHGFVDDDSIWMAKPL